MGIFFKTKKAMTPHLAVPYSLPFRGGEILGLFLDNFTDNVELIKETILRNEKLSNRPSMPFLVTYEVMNTEMTGEIAEFLVDSVMRMSQNIKKLAFVGAARQGRRNLAKRLSKYGNDIKFAVEYFNGYEPAKEWLIPIRK